MCSTWRDAFAAANVQIAGWHTLSWTFAGSSRAKPDASLRSSSSTETMPIVRPAASAADTMHTPTAARFS